MVRLLGGLAVTVMALDCAPRGRHGRGQGRGRKGGGLSPELAAYRISEGCSPNLQSEVGRLVGLMPIAAARDELLRSGMDLDEQAARRIGVGLGVQMLATRTRDLERFRRGELPAGGAFAGKSIAVQMDGGRVRVRTVVKKSRVGRTRKRRKFGVEWREPKVVTIFEWDEKGRMVRGGRPVIDGTLQGPDALIELVAFHLHRLGAAQAKAVAFVADGAPWIWKRLDWVVAQVKRDPARVVEVLDGCQGVHHLSLALAALPLAEGQRSGLSSRLRGLLKQGKSTDVIRELKVLAAGQPEGSPVRREVRYLSKHSDEGRLRSRCFRCRRLPIGSGAIESTIRRVINLRLKGGGIYWTEDNAEAVFQLRAAVLSGRWDEILAHTHEAVSRNRNTDWRWEPPACLAELKALEEDEELKAQRSPHQRTRQIVA